MSYTPGAEYDEGHKDTPEPCPMGCGNLTHDPGGGPCKRCWDEVRRRDREKRARERERDEQWRRDIAEMQDSV